MRPCLITIGATANMFEIHPNDLVSPLGKIRISVPEREEVQVLLFVIETTVPVSILR